MAEEDYERVLCVKSEVFVFRIPPRATNRGYRAADWKLDQPDWTGRLRVCSKASEIYIKLEDNSSGELFANCPVDAHPGIAIESVTDSSRYFVLRIKDESGRHAFIGMGFQDRGDSFDFNVSLQDHFKRIKQTEELEQEATKPDTTPKLDLGFKEGQTIRINFGNKTSSAQGSKSKATGNVGILPPPPGGNAAGPKLVPPSGPRQTAFSTSSDDQPFPQDPQQANVPTSNPPADWGDFASASAPQQASKDGSWVQF